MLNKYDNVVKCLNVLNDESDFNTHCINNISVDLNTRDKGNKKFGLTVEWKKRKKEVSI
jgi:hypothetical protein